MGIKDNLSRKYEPGTAEALPRWKQIINLPGDTKLWDISNGKEYLRSHLRPLYLDKSGAFSKDFEVILTGERVYEPFLRLRNDKYICRIAGGSA